MNSIADFGRSLQVILARSETHAVYRRRTSLSCTATTCRRWGSPICTLRTSGRALTLAGAKPPDDPAHFKLLADLSSISGERHRVFEVMPGAGTPKLRPRDPLSCRMLAPSRTQLRDSLMGGLRRTPALNAASCNFIDHGDLRAPSSFFDRALFEYRAIGLSRDPPTEGVVALLDHVEPTVLGLTRDDAIWAGYGMRVYDLSAAWSPVWRVGPDFAELPASLLQTCESSVDGQLDLRLLGEPGDAITAGPGDAELSGAPQITNLAVRDCQKLAFSLPMPTWRPSPSFVQRTPFPTTRRSRKLPASVLTVAPTAMSPLSICGTETPTAFHSHPGRSFASTGPDVPAWFRSKPTRASRSGGGPVP